MCTSSAFSLAYYGLISMSAGVQKRKWLDVESEGLLEFDTVNQGDSSIATAARAIITVVKNPFLTVLKLNPDKA